MRYCYNRCVENGISYDIKYENMYKLIKNYNAIIIDVRSNQEFKEGHINGAINIPLCDIKRKISNIIADKNIYIIAYCTSGIRSKKAQDILKSLGYKNVYNLIPGFQGTEQKSKMGT